MPDYSEKAWGPAGAVTQHMHAGLFTKFTVKFSHNPSGNEVAFPAILTDYADNFTSNWDTEEYYGRMDAVGKFRNTQRAINFTIKVISDGPAEAIDNLSKFQQLTRFLYPTYRASDDAAVNPYGITNANLISGAPLIGIKMGNLIQSVKPAAGAPLLGWVDGFEMRPDSDLGFWLGDGLSSFDERMRDPISGDPLPGALEESSEISEKIYMPKAFEISCNFHVVHQHSMGWSESGQWMGTGEGFPYTTEVIKDHMPDHLREAVIVGQGKIYRKAPIVKTVKRGLLDALFGLPED